jgi:hypothetical protein
MPARGHSAAGKLRRARPRSRLFLGFWRVMPAIFRDGICDHAIKKLCRVYVSRTVCRIDPQAPSPCLLRRSRLEVLGCVPWDLGLQVLNLPAGHSPGAAGTTQALA